MATYYLEQLAEQFYKIDLAANKQKHEHIQALQHLCFVEKMCGFDFLGDGRIKIRIKLFYCFNNTDADFAEIEVFNAYFELSGDVQDNKVINLNWGKTMIDTNSIDYVKLLSLMKGQVIEKKIGVAKDFIGLLTNIFKEEIFSDLNHEFSTLIMDNKIQPWEKLEHKKIAPQILIHNKLKDKVLIFEDTLHSNKSVIEFNKRLMQQFLTTNLKQKEVSLSKTHKI